MNLTEPEITAGTAEKLGLIAEEFEKIKGILGRVPNFTELSLFSVMWSESCSNKNAIKWLKTLPSPGKRLLVSTGSENTGLLDIGDGLTCAFKIAPCHQPSSLLPEQTGATATQSIHRDLFTMGARPIASLNSLYFGNIDAADMRPQIEDVVKNIWTSANNCGIPTVADEVFFHESPHQPALLSVLTVGIAKKGETLLSKAGEPGNPVFVAWPRTDRDTVVLTNIPSDEPPAENGDELPVADTVELPAGKRLLEAMVEAIKTGAVTGVQEIGEAGVARPTAELCARSKTGMRIDLDKLPTDQENPRPWDFLQPEASGQMLLVGKKEQTGRLAEVFEKWSLAFEQIGEVTDTGLLSYFIQGEKVAEVPVFSLVRGGGAPVYDRENMKPGYLAQASQFNLNKVKVPANLREAAKKMFASPNLVSKKELFESLGGESAPLPCDAVVLPVDGCRKSPVATISCNPYYVQADPQVGTMIAVAEAARKITCTGGVPVAVASVLHFGNPYNPEVYYQFVHSIKGLGDACKKFDTAITDTSVSFYNQTLVGEKPEPTSPTPTIGMLGILEDPAHQTSLHFKQAGDCIYMLGNSYNDLNSSEYLRAVHGVRFSPAPSFDLHEEFELQAFVRAMIRKKMLKSAHGVSKGGLFANLIESAIISGLGFLIETVEAFRKDCFLFGESQSRAVITVAPERDDEFQNFLINNNVSFTKLGEVFGTEVVIDGENFGHVSAWKSIIESPLGQKVDTE